jgi:hypothetical protein
MNLAHAERRSAPLLPLAILAALLAALALAVAAFVLTLTDDDGGTTVVREVSVTPAAEAPAHFEARPDEGVLAASVGAAANPSVSEQQAQYRYGTSQYRVNPSTGYAAPLPDGANSDVYGWHDKP